MICVSQEILEKLVGTNTSLLSWLRDSAVAVRKRDLSSTPPLRTNSSSPWQAKANRNTPESQVRYVFTRPQQRFCSGTGRGWLMAAGGALPATTWWRREKEEEVSASAERRHKLGEAAINHFNPQMFTFTAFLCHFLQEMTRFGSFFSR